MCKGGGGCAREVLVLGRSTLNMCISRWVQQKKEGGFRILFNQNDNDLKNNVTTKILEWSSNVQGGLLF